MRNFDFSPFYRSSVGFDRLFDLLENSSQLHAIDSWPPYDIVKTGEDSYRITVAVAGFGENEIEITQAPNLLLVKGQKAEREEGEVLHRGIAGRAFERRFELADFVRVKAASLKDGLLGIELVREVPEAMKPRRIAVQTASPAEKPAKQIEQKAA
jgi:molecular chaperone IbpA